MPAWVKVYIETANDPKVTGLEPELRWCWVATLLLAGHLDSGDRSGRLEYGPGDPLPDRAIAEFAHVPPGMWQTAREFFLRRGMLRIDQGTLVVAHFAARQASTDPTAAERVARWRDRKRNVTGGVTEDVTRNVTGHVTRTKRQMLRVEAEAEAEVPPPSEVGASRAAPPRSDPYIGVLTPAQRQEVLDALSQVPHTETLTAGDWARTVNAIAKLHERDPVDIPDLLRRVAWEMVATGGLDHGQPIRDPCSYYRGMVNRAIRDGVKGNGKSEETFDEEWERLAAREAARVKAAAGPDSSQ